MFRTVPMSIIRSFSLYTQQWYMSYSLLAGSQVVSKPVWHIPLLCVQCWNPDDGQRNCPKHVKFYSKNKFKELVHIVGFIIIIIIIIIYNNNNNNLVHLLGFIKWIWSLTTTLCAYLLSSYIKCFDLHPAISRSHQRDFTDVNRRLVSQ